MASSNCRAIHFYLTSRDSVCVWGGGGGGGRCVHAHMCSGAGFHYVYAYVIPDHSLVCCAVERIPQHSDCTLYQRRLPEPAASKLATILIPMSSDLS